MDSETTRKQKAVLAEKLLELGVTVSTERLQAMMLTDVKMVYLVVSTDGA